MYFTDKIAVIAICLVLSGCWGLQCACVEGQGRQAIQRSGPAVKLNADIPPGTNLAACVC